MSSASPSPSFQRIIAVDGSASSRPVRGVDSIWLGLVDGGEPIASANLSTRHELRSHLVELADRPGRTLIAVDWSLGYPSGTANAFGLHGATPQRAMWVHLHTTITDGPDNDNNRFRVADELNARVGPQPSPGPFWGVPRTAASATITSTKQPFVDVSEWRLAEARVRSAKRWVSSCWQLGGAGAVGGQSLVGIPLVAQVLDELSSRRAVVWPFDTGLAEPDDQADVVIVEMWPSWFVTADQLANDRRGLVRDALQVELMARVLHAADLDGRLASWFEPDIPASDVDRVVREEGWILGLP